MKKESDFEGVLPMHKPAGWTSHDVVAKMRRLTGIRRIGHAGTLDPDATGVLPLCLGRATRLIEYIQNHPKEYVAELIIGFSTDTLDTSGTVIERAERVELDRERIEEAVSRFSGLIEQVPPMYSAVRHQGKRLYELAREGREVERAPRRVFIHDIEAERIELGGEYPKVRLRVLCSKGTYIRVLCADIGRALGYPAVMSSLVRTAAGGITLDRCISPEEAELRIRDGTIAQFIIRPEDALGFMPKLVLPEAMARRAAQGQTLKLERLLVPDKPEEAAGTPSPDGGGRAVFADPEHDREKIRVRLFADSGKFCGVFTYFVSAGSLRPEKVLMGGDALP